MIRNMCRLALAVVILLAVAVPSVFGDTFVDSGAAGIWGVVVRPDSNVEAVVQPFSPWISGYADRIGIAVGSGADPNHVGFKVTISEISSETSFLKSQLPGEPITGNWTLMPVQGAALVYSYINIDPVYLQKGKTYGLIVEPGDSEMYGSVAFCFGNVPAWGISDDWTTVSPLSYRTAIRIYGTRGVPEPSSLIALFSGFAGLGGVMWRRKKGC